MRGLAQNTACAAAMLNRLVLFDRIEITGENPPWVIFEELIPIVMRGLPHNAAFIDARLFNVVRIAVGMLPAESIVDICDGWIGWLEGMKQKVNCLANFHWELVRYFCRVPPVNRGFGKT